MGKKATGQNLRREDVKQYLQQYYVAKQKKIILENRKRVLSEELRAPSIGHQLRDMPTTKGGRTDGAVSVVFRIAEVEERIEEQRADMSKVVLNVMDLLDLLPENSMERTVAEMRHIDCLTWEKIADAVAVRVCVCLLQSEIYLEAQIRNPAGLEAGGQGVEPPRLFLTVEPDHGSVRRDPLRRHVVVFRPFVLVRFLGSRCPSSARPLLHVFLHCLGLELWRQVGNAYGHGAVLTFCCAPTPRRSWSPG